MLESPLLLIIGAAFVSGFIVQRVNLPPLVGFLLAGFGLHAYGIEDCPPIEQIAELGVTILLFTIGLKLDIRLLLRREVLFGATLHTLLTVSTIALSLALLSGLDLPLFDRLHPDQWWLLAFALSFSSTVLAIKALQAKGELNSSYGRLSLGILVIQDLLAVLFLTFTTGKMPTQWVWLLLLLPLCRPLLYRLLSALGHDEVLILCGIAMALLPGAGLFHLCGLNPELGALVLGMLLAAHPRASELSKSLFSLKELCLVGFFVHIGLVATPTWRAFNLALLLLVILPLKGFFYYAIVRYFRFRVRTGLQTAITLCNFSEFGLIVGNIAAKKGLLDSQWLVVLALTTALSFFIAAPIKQLTDHIYLILSRWGAHDDNDKLHPEDRLIDPGNAKILILGMGRVGACAYDEMYRRYGDVILGVELRPDNIQCHVLQGRNVIVGDAADPDFWQRIIPKPNICLIMLAMPYDQSTQLALQQLRRYAFHGRVAAIVQYEDEMTHLQELGIDATFSVYDEAGSGFAHHVITTLNTDKLLEDNLNPIGEDTGDTAPEPPEGSKRGRTLIHQECLENPVIFEAAEKERGGQQDQVTKK